MSAYVCSEHTTEPVTWKGTGCRQCEHEQRYGQRRATPDPLTGAYWDRWREQHAAVHTFEVPQ